MNKVIRTLLVLSLFNFGPLAHASTSESTAQESSVHLVLNVNGKVRTFGLDDLRAITPERTFQVNANPAYNGASKVYRGFDFSYILSLVGRGLKLSDYEVVITCLDGYRPVLDPAIFLRGGAYLVYREESPDPVNQTDDHLWSLVSEGQQKISPGPLYIVWSTTANYPLGWPFQIQRIELIKKVRSK